MQDIPRNPKFDSVRRNLQISVTDNFCYHLAGNDISGTIAFNKTPKIKVTIIKLVSKIIVNFLPINLINITNEVIHIEVDANENAMAVPSKSPP